MIEGIIIAAMIGALIVLMRWPDGKWGFSSWERVEFDFANYFRLRDHGQTHDEAIATLERIWQQRHG